MKAFVCRSYGGPEVVEPADLPEPLPAAGEVLVRIHFTTVTSGDWRVRTLSMPRGFGPVARLALGFRRPRQPVLGTELAGTIAAVGAGVTRFRVGDAVFAFPGSKMGCHAEYRVIAADGPIAGKPANLSFEEAASLPFGAVTALDFFRRANLRAGERLLVVGASGCVGSALVQLGAHRGAEVTAVTSTGNATLVASLGASAVIDYMREDVAARGGGYDVIADTVGAVSCTRYRHLLGPNGRLLAIAGGVPDLLARAWLPFVGRQRLVVGPSDERPAYIGEIAELAASGALRPVIDRCFDFAQMAEAHAYVDTRRKRGSAVVRVAAPEPTGNRA